MRDREPDVSPFTLIRADGPYVRMGYPPPPPRTETDMPVSLPQALTPADLLAAPAASGHQRSVTERLADWLRQAEARRAERLIAQYVCDAGIRDLSDAVERDIVVRHTRLS